MEPLICKTNDDLKDALTKKALLIKVDNKEIANRIVLIKKIRPGLFAAAAVTAGIAIATAISLAVVPIYDPVTGGLRFGGSAVTATTTIILVGLPAAWAIILLGISLGGIALVKDIYNKYTITENQDGYIILKLK